MIEDYLDILILVILLALFSPVAIFVTGRFFYYTTNFDSPMMDKAVISNNEVTIPYLTSYEVLMRFTILNDGMPEPRIIYLPRTDKYLFYEIGSDANRQAYLDWVREEINKTIIDVSTMNVNRPIEKRVTAEFRFVRHFTTTYSNGFWLLDWRIFDPTIMKEGDPWI